MKIFVLKVPEPLQPAKQAFQYPAHNRDYGIEQDFLIWLTKQPNLVTNDPQEADRHYLPVYWTRWHINHNFAAKGEGLEKLKALVDRVILDDAKTFTITQFDGGTLLNLGQTIEFTGARTTNDGIDVPILCSTHRIPPVRPAKNLLATFNGSFDTHPIRKEMKERFSGSSDIAVADPLPTRFYKRWFWAMEYNLRTMSSYIALCPRGTSCNSFRFFEAMQFGTAPCLIGDRDVRPFKRFIPWDDISYYASSTDSLEELLANVDRKEALEKGRLAYRYWKDELYYQKWCKYVIKELEQPE